jgi:hypothetical protein
MVTGLLWDAVLHGRDPAAGHAESTVFTLANPAHAVLLGGGALAIVGLVGGMARVLSLSGSRWLSSQGTRVVLVMGVVVLLATTGGVLQWSAKAQVPIATGPLAPKAGPESHGVGIVNAHAAGECRPTAAQKEAAARLIADTEAGTAKYKSLAVAVADGYAGVAQPTVTEHYTKAALTSDGRMLDTQRPESLIYTPTARGPVLVGAMYFTNVPGEFGPEPGGCLTRWHIHENLCFSTATWQIATVLEKVGDPCPAGQMRLVPPAALHVWFVDVPGGRFAAEVDPGYLAMAVGP